MLIRAEINGQFLTQPIIKAKPFLEFLDRLRFFHLPKDFYHPQSLTNFQSHPPQTLHTQPQMVRLN